jgi:hypothetical protein
MKSLGGLRKFTDKKKQEVSNKPWALWTMRKHQEEVFSKLLESKRNVLIWHRRAGKDLLAVNYILHQSQVRRGLYWHVYPTYSQGKKALWDAMDSEGNKFIDAFAGEKNSTDMSVRMANGSKYQIIGSDSDPSSIRGANPIGVVFSEYSYMKPDIWDVVRPILSENGGWALFLYTPCGQNHGYDLYKMATENEAWYAEKLGVNETGVVSHEEIKQLESEGASPELIAQEYYCEFLNYVYGSYFAGIVNERERQGFITGLNIMSGSPVNTYWDIGHNTCVWFVQKQGEFWCAIDYIEGQGQPIEYYLMEIKKKCYFYGEHVFPHDISNKEYASGHSRLETAKKLVLEIGLQGNILRQERMSLNEGLNLLRQFIDKCKVDSVKCKQGLKALVAYKRAYSEKNKIYLDYPEKNQWAGHATDALRYVAIDCLQKDTVIQSSFVPKSVVKSYNYIEY